MMPRETGGPAWDAFDEHLLDIGEPYTWAWVPLGEGVYRLEVTIISAGDHGEPVRRNISTIYGPLRRAPYLVDGAIPARRLYKLATGKTAGTIESAEVRRRRRWLRRQD
jgi:hypothetical protein